MNLYNHLFLFQNPDIVLVHYLNVPYPDSAKLSIPVLSYGFEKKEWTKDELADQLRPMCKYRLIHSCEHACKIETQAE